MGSILIMLIGAYIIRSGYRDYKKRDMSGSPKYPDVLWIIFGFWFVLGGIYTAVPFKDRTNNYNDYVGIISSDEESRLAVPKDKSLKEIVKYYESVQCPKDITYAIFSSITCDKDNVVTFIFEMKDGYDMDKIFPSKEEMKRFMSSAFQTGTDWEFTEILRLINSNPGKLKMLFTNKNKRVVIEFSTTEIQDMLDNTAKNMINSITSTTPLSQDVLEQQLSVINNSCPFKQSEITKITGVAIEGEFVVFDVLFDETYADFEILHENTEELKGELKELVGNMSGSKFTKSIKERSLGVKYRYTGNISKKNFEVSVESSDL